jgi:hypothetical protein
VLGISQPNEVRFKAARVGKWNAARINHRISFMRRRATGKGNGATFKRNLKVQLLSNPYKFTCQGLLDI